MIDVDLLPPDEVRHAAEMRRVRLWCRGILAVAVVSFSVAHGAVELAATVSGRRLGWLEAELAGLRRPAAALGRLRQRRAALDGRLRTIATFLVHLRGERPFRDVDLDEAARDDRVPSGVRRFVVSGQIGDAK